MTGFSWIHLDSLEITWIHWDSLGFTSTHLDSLGFIWIHLDSLGFAWLHLDSLASPEFIWKRLPRPKGKRERDHASFLHLQFNFTSRHRASHARTKRNPFPGVGSLPEAGLTDPNLRYMHSRMLIAKLFVDMALSHFNRQAFCTLHSRTLIAKFCFDTALSLASATEFRVQVISMESMGSLRALAPYKLSGEGNDHRVWEERALALYRPIRTQPLFIHDRDERLFQFRFMCK